MTVRGRLAGGRALDLHAAPQLVTRAGWSASALVVALIVMIANAGVLVESPRGAPEPVTTVAALVKPPAPRCAACDEAQYELLAEAVAQRQYALIDDRLAAIPPDSPHRSHVAVRRRRALMSAAVPARGNSGGIYTIAARAAPRCTQGQSGRQFAGCCGSQS